jgi:hypothetical protein
MKKFLAFLVVLGVGGFLVYRYVITSASERSCARLASLCGDKSAAVDQCVKGVNELGKASSDAVSKFESCVGDAKSCQEGAGCMVGAVVGAGVGAAGKVLDDFMKGIGKAIGK